jgi:hypothetical protein
MVGDRDGIDMRVWGGTACEKILRDSAPFQGTACPANLRLAAAYPLLSHMGLAEGDLKVLKNLNAAPAVAVPLCMERNDKSNANRRGQTTAGGAAARDM